MKKLYFLLVFTVLNMSVFAQTVMVRPSMAIGYYTSDGQRGLSYNYGGKVLLMANNFQRYGILINHLTLPGDRSYLSTGIYLEQVLFGHFNMGIGTVGYISLGDLDNTFGLYTHLGFEKPFARRFHFLITYQSEMIFSRRVAINSSLMFGAGVLF